MSSPDAGPPPGPDPTLEPAPRGARSPRPPIPPAAWPALVALLGVVAAGLLLVSSGSWLPTADTEASPAVAGLSPSPGSGSPPPATPVPSAGASPQVAGAPTPDPSALAAWPPRPAPPAGWAYELACDDEGRGCRLHLRDASGAELPGWPVRLSGTCWGDEPATGPNGTAYVACDSGGRSPRVTVHALRLDGTVPPGWPVKLQGEMGGIAVALDGTVYVDASASIHALEPDGAPRPGWPRTLPYDNGGFAVAPDGAVVGWWYEGIAEDTIDLQARRTKYTTIAPDGRTLPGWPITSIGTASEPVIARDGTVYYVSATEKVYGHDRSGEIARGWPYQLSAATWTGVGPAAPTLRDDGRLMFVAAGWNEDNEKPLAQVTVLMTSGTVARGWPYRTKGDIAEPGCCTGCFPSPLFDLSDAGTLYLAPWEGDRARVIALDAEGQMVPGWPRRLGPSWRPNSIAARPDGGVDIGVADASGPDGGCVERAPETVTVAADGSVVRDVGASTLAEVYDAVRPQRLRTAGGATTFAPGQPIELAWDLVNTSRAPLVLPHAAYWRDDDYERAYLAGVEQLWLERLGPDPTIGCISSGRWKGTWYAVGGMTVALEAPVTLDPGARLARKSSLPDLSACLPPGTYRLHLELHELGYDAELDDDAVDPIAETLLDFRIPGPSATPSPSPSPRPTPTPTPSPPPRPAPSPSPDATPAP